MSKKTVDIICAALLAIVSALRKEYGLSDKNNITVIIHDGDSVAGVAGYEEVTG